MGLETGVTYIEDLDETWPIGAVDTLDEADDHLRNVKIAVKGSFPNLGAAAYTGTAAELNRADLTAATGTVTAEEFLTTDASKDIGTFNNVTSTTFTGALSGNATTATTAANLSGSNLTGDVTNVDNAMSIAAGVVDTTELADNAVTIDKLETTAGTDTSTVINVSAVWDTTGAGDGDGWYACAANVASVLTYQCYVGGAWRHVEYVPDTASTPAGGVYLIVDGSSRIQNTSASNRTLNYRKMMG